LDEARTQGSPVALAEPVARLWERTQAEEGAESDFTSVVKPMEQAAGVTIGPV
ncbi:oxidoreductase, partial [Mycobacterium sp. ITM-2017-0098]